MSLYLKYRPQDFDNLVWQNFIKQTLQKAISADKTVGAYLFCGPRGTGKTSSARIFAKAINCESPREWNPCLECSVCKDFATESLVDIIEIDAASHTWVDNIREIIERAQFTPNKTKFKIYIVDEVHMLSKWAFNALLKILEEPPAHVKFILATTETHKVPDTIISRCQRYDFKSISQADIEQRLQFIAQKEWVTVDSESLQYIVKNSGGALRNAISLFEQLIEDGNIEYTRVVEKLGIVQDDVLKNFLQKLLDSDNTIIENFDEFVASGKNMKLFFRELIFFAKKDALKELKSGKNISNHIKTLEILDDTYAKTKNSLDENTTFLIWVLKIVTHYVPVENAVIQKQPAQKTSATSSMKAVEKKVVTEEIPPVVNQPLMNPHVTSEPAMIPNVSVDDAFDIFSDDATAENPADIQESVSAKAKTPFDTKSYIDTLKNAWAKWGLTMALRGSEIYLQGSKLHVKTKTKIAAGQVDNVDNKTLMVRALWDMGIENPELVIL